jgi:hypothetical protein
MSFKIIATEDYAHVKVLAKQLSMCTVTAEYTYTQPLSRAYNNCPILAYREYCLIIASGLPNYLFQMLGVQYSLHDCGGQVAACKHH